MNIKKCMDTCEKVFELAKSNPELDVNGNIENFIDFHSEAKDALNPIIFKTDLEDCKEKTKSLFEENLR